MPPAPLIDGAITRLVAARHGYLLYNRFDDTIGRAIAEYGEWGEHELAVSGAFIEPGFTVVDAGAYIGTHTLCFSRATGPAGRVIAFEPQPFSFRLLSANIALNSLQNITAYPAGLSSETRSITLHPLDPATPANFGAVRLLEEASGEPSALMTLDSLGLAACHLVKLDCEEMEIEALRGAAETVSRLAPVIYAESLDVPASEAVRRFLRDRGYRIYNHHPPAYNSDNFYGNPEDIFGGATEPNILCLPPGRSLPAHPSIHRAMQSGHLRAAS